LTETARTLRPLRPWALAVLGALYAAPLAA
jgi:hypothetical protein